MADAAESPWPMRIFILIFATVGVLELARNGLSLESSFYLLGAVGFLMANGWERSPAPRGARKTIGIALMIAGTVLMGVHLLG